MNRPRPFRRQFSIDIVSEIVGQMDRKELLTFSLTNRNYNDEANRILWRTAHLAFDAETRTLVPSSKAIRRDVSRARHIRTLVISPKRILGFKSLGDAWRKQQVQTMYVPDEVPLWTWKLVAAVIRGIPHLEHLEIRDAPSSWMGQVAWRAPILERLLELSVASPLAHLRSFTTSLPLADKMTLFCARCPRLERIVVHKTYPIHEAIDEDGQAPKYPASAFQHLKHVTGPIEFVFSTIPGHPITEIHTNLGLSKADELRAALLKSSVGIRSLHISSIFSSTHPLAPALSRLAPLPIVNLHAKYLLSSHVSNDIPTVNAVPELWGPEMARSLSRFPSLEVFRCEIIMQARMSESEINDELSRTAERIRWWGRTSTTLSKLHLTYKHGHGLMDIRFGRKIGGEWHSERAS